MRILSAESVGSRAASVLAACLLCSLSIAAPARAGNVTADRYLSPMPGSRNVSPWNNVVIRHAATLAADQIADTDLSVTGSHSGRHPGKLTLSDDSKTLVFLPSSPFALGETVNVRWERGPKSTTGERLPALAFHFAVATTDPKRVPPARSLEAEMPPTSAQAARASSLAQLAIQQPCDTLPTDWVPLTVTINNNPPPGYLYLTPGEGTIPGGHLVILDNRGQPVFAREVAGFAGDLSPQQGLWTYFNNAAYHALNASYDEVDTYQTGNGYTTDSHDMRLLPNGHAILMAYDPETVDMDTVVAGGQPGATVTGLILQEIDAAKNVVVQWRSWDHFKITDMIEVPGRSLTGTSIDYCHGNAIEVDSDGNILLSSRNMCEITKINWSTGDIIWRLGRNAKNNQFSFPNDPRGNSHQHDIRRLSNGNITMFDNGNNVDPQRSRGLEYSLDEQNKIATEVWEFRNTPDIFAPATGSTRRDATGGTLICWGINTPTTIKVTELHADGTKALEITSLPGARTYRAVRAPWQTTRFVTDLSSIDFGSVRPGFPATRPLSIHNNAATPLELTCIVSTDAAFTVNESMPLTIPAGGDAVIHVQFAPTADGSYGGTLYIKSIHGTELIAQVVAISGIGDSVTGVDWPIQVGLWLRALPNPSGGVTSLGFGMPKAGRAELRIYDLRGRLVATPFAGPAGPGLNVVKWEGRADDGEVLGSGIYFARLTTGAGKLSIKLSLSR